MQVLAWSAAAAVYKGRLIALAARTATLGPPSATCGFKSHDQLRSAGQAISLGKNTPGDTP
jgi:hypothetical protein